MTVGEQEIKGQVAEMRQALQEAAEARRRAGIAKLVGTLVGVTIVVIFVLLYWSLVRSIVQNPDQLRAAINTKIVPLQLGDKFRKVAVDSMPILQENLLKLWKDFGDDPKAKKMVAAMWEEDILPTMRSKVKNDVMPALRRALDDQREKFTEQLQEKLSAKVKDRIGAMAQKSQDTIQEGTDLTEAQLDEILKTLREAGESAAEKAVTSRLDTLQDEIEKLRDHREALLKRGSKEDREDADLVQVLLRLVAHKVLEADKTLDETSVE